MAPGQRALVRYWLIGAALLALVTWLTWQVPLRVIIIPALLTAALVDRTLRPHPPEDVPTALEIIEDSPGWRAFFVLYALGAVAAALLSATVAEIGSWLVRNAWLLFPLVILPILGPLLQNQVAAYRAFGDNGRQCAAAGSAPHAD